MVYEGAVVVAAAAWKGLDELLLVGSQLSLLLLLLHEWLVLLLLLLLLLQVMALAIIPVILCGPCSCACHFLSCGR
jgi:hypothetical protein